jgi:hypothetical protein
MAISVRTRDEISSVLINAVRTKIQNYEPETEYKPFHYSLLGRDRYALFSFIHSMNTTFGMSIWEQISVLLSLGAGYESEKGSRLLSTIDPKTEIIIQNIQHDLRSGSKSSNKEQENELIRNSILPGTAQKDPDSVVDFYVKIPQKNGGFQENFIDITSVKPNIKEFAALKLKLLRWTALRLSQDRKVNVFTRIAIPYNPYHPYPYERWTLRGLYDLDAGEILVGEEYWNFVGGSNVYDELVVIFEEVGELLRDEIDEKFAEFRGNS